MGAYTVGRGCYVLSASAAHRLVYVLVSLSPGCNPQPSLLTIQFP